MMIGVGVWRRTYFDSQMVHKAEQRQSHVVVRRRSCGLSSTRNDLNDLKLVASSELYLAKLRWGHRFAVSFNDDRARR